MHQRSVIIPNYNGAKFLNFCLESVIAQEVEKEIIVIDDGSTDYSLDVVEHYVDQVKLIRQSNQGAPKARNAGLEVCKGKYIKFLDADDVLLPGVLAKQLAQAEALKDEKAIVYGDAQWINEQGEPIQGYHPRAIAAGEDPVVHILTNCPLTSTPLHRRDYLMEIGGFDESIIKGQEHDLHLRLVLAGVKFVHLPGFVYQYREYQGTNRISSKKADPSKALAYYQSLKKQETLIKEHLSGALNDNIKQVLAGHYWKYGRMVLRQGFADAAKKYFERARELMGKQFSYGSGYYQRLVQLIGPIWSEKALGILK